MQLAPVTPPAPQLTRSEAAQAIFEPTLDLAQRVTENLEGIKDPATATPAQIVAGVDGAAYASTVSDALRAALQVAPEAAPQIEAAQQAVAGIATLVDTNKSNTTAPGEDALGAVAMELLELTTAVTVAGAAVNSDEIY